MRIVPPRELAKATIGACIRVVRWSCCLNSTVIDSWSPNCDQNWLGAIDGVVLSGIGGHLRERKS
jgi:hypothetical protein